MSEPKIINFVILAAGIGYKMRSYEPRSLLKFDKIPLIIHQIKEIQKLESKEFCPRIFVITGYRGDRISKKLAKEKVIIVNVDEYEKSNQYGSIRALKFIHTSMYGRPLDNIFLIHGDIYFQTDLGALPYDSSFILYDTKDRFKAKEVGVNIGDGLGSLSYGAKTKWCQMAYVNDPEMKLMNNNEDRFEDFMLTFEVINQIVNSGGRFETILYEGKIFEIDRIKEYRIEKFNFV